MTTLTRPMISALTRCAVIARYGTGTGTDIVDAATRHGIQVTNVLSDWCENEVADHPMALLLATARKDPRIRRGDPGRHLAMADWTPANPLFSLDNVGITSHAAHYSQEAIGTVRDFAASEAVRVLTGKPPLSPVSAIAGGHARA